MFIFASATLGLQRQVQQWLPLNLVAKVSADYSVNAPNTLKVARVVPGIVEAVKQDSLVEELNLTTALTVALPETTLSPAITPTPTPTPDTLALVPALTVNMGGPYLADEGSSIGLAIVGLSPGVANALGAVTYRWDLDNDGKYDDAEGIETSVTFYDEGKYLISVLATDFFGREAIDSAIANVRNAPPTVNVGLDLFVDEAEKFLLSATVSDPGHDILIYEWDFGDGSRRVHDTLHPEHTYRDDGDYAVRLRVKDNDGGMNEDYVVVYVGNLPPEANAGSDLATNEGALITFNGNATDPGEDDLTYAWDFNYNGQDFTPDASGSTVSTIYPDGPTNLVAALAVQDDDGDITIDTVNVTVNNLPPVIAGVSNNGPVGEGKPLTLAVSATDPGNDALAYAFDWDNDGLFDAVNQPATLLNIWYDEGDYTVRVRVRDKDGAQALTSTIVSTFNLTPTAIAQVPGSTFFEGTAVSFDAGESSDPGINDVLTYQWNFGDSPGVTTGIAPSHIYGDNGVYTTTLTVTDDSGAADTDTLAITVLNANPVVEAGPDVIVDEGVNVSLTFNGSAIDASNDVLSYTWDFDYDGVAFVAEAFGASVTKNFVALDGPREYLVALWVEDDDGGAAIDTLKVIVNNTPPQNVNALDPFAGEVGQSIQLTAATAIDVPDDTLTYQWDLSYDGANFNAEVIGQIVFNTWNTPGTHNIALRVIDEDGGATIDAAVVNVNLPPIAEAGGPYSGMEGAGIIFDGSGSSDPDGDSLTYSWNFGDGSPIEQGINVTHAYGDNGVYTATLTVRDTDNSESTDVAAVTIVNANPILDAGPDRTATENTLLNLVAAVTDPGFNDALAYAWDFNYDGNTLDQDATGNPVNVTYLDGPASFTVTVRVRDDDYPAASGEIGEAIDSFVVTVNNAPPVANAGGPYAGFNSQPLPLTGAATDTISDTLTFAWDLNYDGLTFTPDAIGQTVTNTWNVSGVYTVALRVTDEDVGVGLNTALVNINTRPTANAGGPYSGNEGSLITLSGSGFDADGDPLTYAWDLDNNGSFETAGQVVTYSWPDNGNYTITLQVNDGRGGLATQSTTVTVNNVPPTANAGGLYITTVNVPVTLNGSGSDVPADPLSYAWDLNNDAIFEISGQTAIFSQTITGTFTVVLQVSDGDGGVTTNTATVQVN